MLYKKLSLMKITKFLGLSDEEIYIKCFKKIFVDYGNIGSFLMSNHKNRGNCRLLSFINEDFGIAT